MKKLLKNKKEISLLVKVMAMVVALISVTFSWFVFAKDAWVNPFEVGVTKVVDVTISKEDKEDSWSNKLEVETKDQAGSITEFSGNGDKLYIPVVENHQISKFYKTDFSDPNKEKAFIEIQTFIKTTGAIKLFLNGDSYVKPLDENNPKDNIAGAVRVAFIVENHKPFIWAPNSTYEYSVDDNNEFSVNKNGTPEKTYSYVYSETEDEFVSKTSMVVINNENQAKSGVSEDKRFVWGNIEEIDNYQENVDPIFTVARMVKSEMVIEMTIRVWVEGTDREAMASLVGGKVNMNLKFDAVALGGE